MRQAKIFVHGREAALFSEAENNGWRLEYADGYDGPPVSLTLPLMQKTWIFEAFPPFFEGLLPEGGQLDGLLSSLKIDRKDFFAQLAATGADLVGAVTFQEKLP